MKVSRSATQFAEARRVLTERVTELYAAYQQVYVELELEVPSDIQPGRWQVRDVDLNGELLLVGTELTPFTVVPFGDFEDVNAASARLHAKLLTEIRRRNDARDRREYAALAAKFAGVPTEELDRASRYLELRARLGVAD